MMQVDFHFLKNNSLLGDQFQLAQRISKLYAIGDNRDVLVNARLAVEALVKKVFVWENLNPYYSVTAGEYRNLRNNTFYLQSNVDYPVSLFNLLNEVRRLGNEAVHDPHFQTSKNQAWRILCDLNDLYVFFLNTYDKQRLNYLRPDIMLEAQQHAKDWYRPRRIKNLAAKKAKVDESPSNQNVRQARAYLNHKKRHHFPFFHHRYHH